MHSSFSTDRAARYGSCFQHIHDVLSDEDLDSTSNRGTVFDADDSSDPDFRLQQGAPSPYSPYFYDSNFPTKFFED